MRIRIRNLNADPDPATQINADPDPKPSNKKHVLHWKPNSQQLYEEERNLKEQRTDRFCSKISGTSLLNESLSNTTTFSQISLAVGQYL